MPVTEEDLMISRSNVDKLLSVHAAEPSVLSLYLWVPRDLPGLRELPARADELFALAARDANGNGSPVRVGREEREIVRELLAAGAREWLGHTIAIFTSAALGLAEAIPLPGELQERAVLATRPHVRPLLLAIQRHPAYRVVVADRRHAWLFSITGEDIRTAALPDAEGVRSRGFGGWYGLEAYRVNERIIELARQHYHDTALLLERAVRAGGTEPLIIGGHQDTIPQVLAALPAGLRDHFAGSFAADPRTLTPARVRELADKVIADWLSHRDQQLTADILHEPPGRLAVTGLSGCIAAANQHDVRLLAVPAGGLLPGYACQRCGVLSSAGDGCPDGPEALLAVPDLIEELAVAALADSGLVRTLRDPPAGIAALLRFPLARP
jgi:hypothetical protein